jgi:hypothetical protein
MCSEACSCLARPKFSFALVASSTIVRRKIKTFPFAQEQDSLEKLTYTQKGGDKADLPQRNTDDP